MTEEAVANKILHGFKVLNSGAYSFTDEDLKIMADKMAEDILKILGDDCPNFEGCSCKFMDDNGIYIP